MFLQKTLQRIILPRKEQNVLWFNDSTTCMPLTGQTPLASMHQSSSSVSIITLNLSKALQRKDLDACRPDPQQSNHSPCKSLNVNRHIANLVPHEFRERADELRCSIGVAQMR